MRFITTSVSRFNITGRTVHNRNVVMSKHTYGVSIKLPNSVPLGIRGGSAIIEFKSRFYELLLYGTIAEFEIKMSKVKMADQIMAVRERSQAAAIILDSLPENQNQVEARYHRVSKDSKVLFCEDKPMDTPVCIVGEFACIQGVRHNIHAKARVRIERIEVSGKVLSTIFRTTTRDFELLVEEDWRAARKRNAKMADRLSATSDQWSDDAQKRCEPSVDNRLSQLIRCLPVLIVANRRLLRSENKALIQRLARPLVFTVRSLHSQTSNVDEIFQPLCNRCVL
ncbi:hypothetical protein EAI_10476 [Harpegnathos saltator]|uniref:Uncharacterized protein n=1 Tax=Harpegnathos saltator TaxID=610380 RepID=E2BXZ3_HARSA|nr:hypothetical protein EAI_10476 [Harpegnathos saltator]